MSPLYPTFLNHGFLVRILAAVWCCMSVPADANDLGRSVVVIYNPKMPGSKSVAEYYAKRRGVPDQQVFGYDLPTSEEISRQEYLDLLQKPLLADLEKTGLFHRVPPGQENPNGFRILKESSIRYATLCYGVPIRIQEDSKVVEQEAASLPPELKRSECSVDSQLACLPMSLNSRLDWTGPLVNPFYQTTNANSMHPTNGLLMVGRLDGPSPEIARGLVDLAMDAETNGLWGRAYIDSRGMTNGPLVLGDEWMRGAFRICRIDFPTEFDSQEATFGADFPLSQVAIYAGWYSQNLTGPFSQEAVDFMPGAFAYHLHSFSARTVRTDHGWWVGPLLAKGATATIGNVYEPYLGYTEDLAQFFRVWLGKGFSFGEAAWSGIRALSWQTIMLGDPLYTPKKQTPRELHQHLTEYRPDLLPWSHLRAITHNLSQGSKVPELTRYIQQNTKFRDSSILLETLADLHWMDKSYMDSLAYYEEALKRPMTAPQKLRVSLKLANQRSFFGPAEKTIANYQRILEEFPEYPGELAILNKVLALAKEEGLSDLVAETEEAIRRLSAPDGTKSETQ